MTESVGFRGLRVNLAAFERRQSLTADKHSLWVDLSSAAIDHASETRCQSSIVSRLTLKIFRENAIRSRRPAFRHAPMTHNYTAAYAGPNTCPHCACTQAGAYGRPLFWLRDSVHDQQS